MSLIQSGRPILVLRLSFWSFLLVATFSVTEGFWISSNGRDQRVPHCFLAEDLSLSTRIFEKQALFSSTRLWVGSSSPITDLIRQTDYLKNPKPKENDLVKKPESLVVRLDNEKCLELLEDSLVSFNSTAASELIQEISNVRQQNLTVASELLDWLLEKGPDSTKIPLWAKWFRFFLGPFSRRARWASLRRTLDLSTPPPTNDQDDPDDTMENPKIRRRRALLTLLRALSSEEEADDDDDDDDSAANNNNNNKMDDGRRRPAIRALERKAMLEQKNSIIIGGGRGTDSMKGRRPAQLETPNYVVVDRLSKSSLEIRRYDDFAVCSVAMKQTMPLPRNVTDIISEPKRAPTAQSFNVLAGYLFGKNNQQRAMKMTTPVITETRRRKFQENEEGEERFMSFVLPSEYWKSVDLETTAPQPLEGSGVTLERWEGGERAVMMFGGYASQQVVQERSRELLRCLKRDAKQWQVVEGESVSLAQYNDPFTPPWKRLNEVSIAVKPRP